MRINRREIGASEAGVALSVVTVVVVALGYAALRFLSGSTDAPPVEIWQASPGEVATSDKSQGGNQEIQPQVLPAQESDGHDVPHLSQRPIWDPKPIADTGHDIDLNGSDSLWPSTDDLPVGTAPLGETPL